LHESGIVPVRFNASEMARLHSEIFGGDILHDELASMNWRRFEDWTLRQITAAGLTANRTPSAGDAGADPSPGMEKHPPRKLPRRPRCQPHPEDARNWL